MKIQVIQLAFSNGTPARAAKLALVVGTLLVLINQWEALFGDEHIDWIKFGLTYCVPYLVSTYTSVSKDLALARQVDEARQQAHREAKH